MRQDRYLEGGEAAVEVYVSENNKLVEYWLSNSDQLDRSLQQHLNTEIQKWKAKKYKVVVFRSGSMDLVAVTKTLINNNLKRMLDKEKMEEANKGAV